MDLRDGVCAALQASNRPFWRLANLDPSPAKADNSQVEMTQKEYTQRLQANLPVPKRVKIVIGD